MMMSFKGLGLRAELLQAVEARGYTTPTPIQTRVIPVALEGRDILACAQTGTGKTDAFALPLVQALGSGGQRRHPRALVLAPTRELALQVAESIKVYARQVSLRCTVVYGGVNVTPQILRLRRGTDILVATPGRLLDLAERGKVTLSRLKFLVFDEADRMLDLGFSDEISAILERVPPDRRTMLFSATYSRQIRDLAAKMLQAPEHIEITPGNTVAEPVVQKVHRVDASNKRALLIHLITRGNWARVLVFTRTKHGANRLAEKLAAKGVPVAALHSNKSQSFRTRTLTDFKNEQIRVLVATDVAARGLDISNLPYVVNYDMPRTPDDYVHRIGRTGRAGVRGIAVSLVSHEERHLLRAVEAQLKHRIRVEAVDGFTEDSVVPDFVLFRPNSPACEKNADSAIKEMVAKRNDSKASAKASAEKPSGAAKRFGLKSKAGGGGRKNKTGKRSSRPDAGIRKTKKSKNTNAKSFHRR